MNNLKFVLPAIFLALSFNVNAIVLNTLGGQQYEWLELTETVGQSRNQIEAQLIDVNSSLYGYEYASRSLVESLFLSYTSWDGLNGYHGDPGVVSGISNLLNDFGPTYSGTSNGTYSTVDGYTISYTGYSYLDGFMGISSECGGGNVTCRVYANVFDNNGVGVMAYQHATYGWDSTNSSPLTLSVGNAYSFIGSYLVKPSVVPLPAAAWLFGSALLGFFGFSRRKANA